MISETYQKTFKRTNLIGEKKFEARRLTQYLTIFKRFDNTWYHSHIPDS